MSAASNSVSHTASSGTLRAYTPATEGGSKVVKAQVAVAQVGAAFAAASQPSVTGSRPTQQIAPIPHDLGEFSASMAELNQLALLLSNS